MAIPLAVILGASVAMYLSIRARVYQNGFEWRTVIAGKHGFTDVSALSATRRYLDLAFRNSNPIFIDTRTIGHGRDVCRAIIEGVQRDNPEAIQPSVYRHFGLLPGREEEADPA
ncbi:MAG TPA: hypothetical protein VHN99_01780 [Deinococcales bacterium]|nr:hypothetical protein [Deinococcales bacterium]